MAKSYELEIEGHPSIYEPRERKLKIYFSEPEKGVNKETGLVLFLSGFGGNANSNVYKKMRNLFADEYNLLTVQCDYFGWEFMQSKTEGLSLLCDFKQFRDYPAEEQERALKHRDSLEILREITKRNQKNLMLIAGQQENWYNFNDMGIMQAIDNITAVLTVMKIVEDNGYPFNSKKVILYGHSQGAYLAHLCNVFAPNLFSLMIDNSAWLKPAYLEEKRMLSFESGVEIIFDYLVRQLEYDKEIYDLTSLYKRFHNTCSILAFHGTDDHLVDYTEKKKLIDSIPKATFYLVGDNDVDKDIFYSTGRGLGADFLKMFRVVMKNYTFPPRKKLELKNIHIHTDMVDYYINYDTGRPQLTCLFPQ